MSKEELKSYILNSTEEPTDEMLEAIMLRVQKAACLSTLKEIWRLEFKRSCFKSSKILYRTSYQCLEEKKDFVFETVFSSDEKLEFLKKAHKAGVLFFTYQEQILGIGIVCTNLNH